MGSTKMSSQPFSANNMFSGTHTNTQTTAIAGSINGINRYISPMTFVNWGTHTLYGLGDSTNSRKNGTGVSFSDYAVDNLKTYLGYPTEIKVSAPATDFSLTSITFDQTDKTFDVI